MSVKNYLKSKHSSEKWNEIEEESKIFVEGLQSLQDRISNELHKIMEDNEIGYREVGKILGTTDAMTGKMLNAGNVNFSTITKLYILNGKVPRIVWDTPKTRKKKRKEKKVESVTAKQTRLELGESI
ncbi:MAG: hypothetical protein AB8C84_00990 [Oligoflexales bacterium]